MLTHIFATSQNIKRFRHFDINQGLAHTDATAITEDENGYIWIGTNAGLQRFDGRQTKLFLNSLSKTDQVYNNRITSLYPSGQNLWIGSEGGIHLFSLKKQKHIQLEYKGQDFDKNSQIVDEITGFDGDIWFISNQELYCGQLDTTNNILFVRSFDKMVAAAPEYLKNSIKLSLSTNNFKVFWIETNKRVASLAKMGMSSKCLKM